MTGCDLNMNCFQTSLEKHLVGTSVILAMLMVKFIQKPNACEAIHQHMTTVAQVENTGHSALLHLPQ